MIREDGYYWVKMNFFGDWQPAKWDKYVWWITGSDICCLEDRDITEVGEKIVKK